MNELQQAKLGIAACIERMPSTNEVELQDIITGLVEDGFLPKSSPASTTNWPIIRAVIEINRQFKKIPKPPDE